MVTKLDKIFDSYVKNSLFRDKRVLQTNYSPETITHRDKEIESVASILAPALKGNKISNLFVYGKTGCISGESLVYTDNGWKKIKDADHKNDKVLSFNKGTQEYEWSNFIFLKFENKDKLLKIAFENGYEIIVTKDHPLLTKSMMWKKADDLTINDEIALAYSTPNISKNTIPLALARLLGFTISDGSLNRRKRRVKHHRGGEYNSDRQRFRYFSENNELLSLVQNDLKEIFKGTPQIIHPKDRCTHVNLISQRACQALYNFGIPFGSKSKIVEIPLIILQSSSVCQREFLKALFSGDGTVSQQTYQIEYYSNSINLLRQVAYLLYQEGIICKIKNKTVKLNEKFFDSHRLYVNGQENLIKYYHKIGFYNKQKEMKLKNLLNKYKRYMGVRKDKYAVSKIVKIEEVYEESVYDLTVPKNNNFVANGVISHNTGKTLSVQYVTQEILKRTLENGEDILKVVYVNCKLKKVADTEYRILAEIINNLGGKVPATGLPTDTIYNKFIEMIDDKRRMVLIVLDEIDQAVKKISDNFLYSLTRLNSELKNAQISLIGISNSLNFMDGLDPRVRSSLGEEEMVFSPYNALQLQDILKERAIKAFHAGVLEEGVLAKCAAYAAREHGDARRALDLLRVAGELAEREGNKKIKIEHIDNANKKIERDKMLDIIENEPKQFQLVLLSIISLIEEGKISRIFTGNIYNKYQEICLKTKIESLTQRRVSDIIAEFDMLGVINADVVSKGRQGRTREIKLLLPNNIKEQAKRILYDSLAI